MPRSLDINFHAEIQLSVLSAETRNAVPQVVETIAADPGLGRSLGPESSRQYYVDVRLEHGLAHIYYAADEKYIYVQHIDFHYLSPQ